MNRANLKKLEIVSNLSFVPQDKLDDISQFIHFLLFMSQAGEKKPISVRGIWENKGFEKIDVETQLKTIRNEIKTNLKKITEVMPIINLGN